MSRIEIIVNDEITVNVRHRTRFSPVRCRQYEIALCKMIPELQTLKTPTNDKEVVSGVLNQTAEWLLMGEVQKFVKLADRISYAEGSPFRMVEQFDDANLLAAFKHYREGNPDDPDDLWVRVELKAAALDQPLTEVYQQPTAVAGELDPEAVGGAQRG